MSARTAQRLIAKGMTGTHAAIYRASGGKVVGLEADPAPISV